MSSLPLSLKRVRLETAEKKVATPFSYYKFIVFFDAKGQLIPQSAVGLRQTPPRSLVHFIVTCKYEKSG